MVASESKGPEQSEVLLLRMRVRIVRTVTRPSALPHTHEIATAQHNCLPTCPSGMFSFALRRTVLPFEYIGQSMRAHCERATPQALR
jgi:hypothetical protein